MNNNNSCLVTDCHKCDLSLFRTNIVNGSGNRYNNVMFIGEAPGYMEDKQGLPFVGHSGKLLNIMLSLIGLTRNDIYITNVIKCRPQNNRTPTVKEIRNCNDYLKQEIEMINPKIVVLMGNVALNTFFNLNTLTVTKIKGRVLKYNGVLVYTIYHPSYILRNITNKTLLSSYMHSFKIIGWMYRLMINPLITFKI